MNRTFSPFLPFLLLSLSIILLLSFQIHFAASYGKDLREQRKLREASVTQAQAANVTLEKLANGLLEIARDDAAARAIIEKHQIRRTPKTDESTPQP